MDKDYLVANHNLEQASKKLGIVHDSVSELLTNMRGKSMDFYYKISLLAGGVLSLSITYIGYLSSIPNHQVAYGEFLYGGWTALLVTVICSIYRNHFNLDMGHYQVVNTENRVRLEEFEASLVMLKTHPESFVNLTSPQEVAKQVKVTKTNIEMVKKGIAANEKKEKRNSFWWVFCQSATHISFPLGLVLVTLFAALNLPIPISFIITLFNR